MRGTAIQRLVAALACLLAAEEETESVISAKHMKQTTILYAHALQRPSHSLPCLGGGACQRAHHLEDVRGAHGVSVGGAGFILVLAFMSREGVAYTKLSRLRRQLTANE